MLAIRDARMAKEEEIFGMTTDMRNIRAKRLDRATKIAEYDRELRVHRTADYGSKTVDANV